MYCQDCRGAEWQEVVNMITGGTLAGDTEKYRYYMSCGLDDDAQKQKKRMPAFTKSVSAGTSNKISKCQKREIKPLYNN